MATKCTTSTVKGGKIARVAKSGKFHSVVTANNSSRISEVSREKVQTISQKRRDALKRLADR